MALVEVSKAAFGYGKQVLFQDISFQVGAGEIFCLFGPNGCGKSTLLECLLGMIRLQSGQILLHQKEIQELKPRQIAKYLAYVPQVHEKTFPYRVIDVVLMGRAQHLGLFNSPTDEDRQIAEQALSAVGLSQLRHRPYTQLSGGETQLVMLARALTQQTPVIILDEPTAHLDFKHELLVLETIVRLVKESGISIIMATHFPNHAFYFENNQLPTSVALMKAQRFSAVGAPTEVLSEQNMKATFNINAKLVTYRTDDDKEVKQIIPLNTAIS